LVQAMPAGATVQASRSGAGPTRSGEPLLNLPQKRFYRQRAHAHVFADHELDYPASPDDMDWSTLYPSFFPPSAPGAKRVEWADVGCGFGGLLMALAPQFPETLMLGMEIRPAVTAYVSDRIAASRQAQSLLPPSSPQRQPGGYANVAVMRANSMKHMPNFFARAQLSKMFFLFPDPHFKVKKQKARIITTSLLAEYAYVLRPGGILYTVTDVKDLHEWMAHHLHAHPLFEHIPTQELLDDPVLQAARTSTEEGKKVERNHGDKWVACFRRTEDPPWS